MSLRAFGMACSVPWAITPESLQQILEIATRENLPDFEAVEARRARRMDGTDQTKLRNGVAVIDVTGPVFRYADMFTRVSGATAISTLAQDFTAALEDPNVSAILLNIDSPGGEVAGVNEFAQMVFEARSKKPIVAYIDGMGASAAYWIASAADEIVADATALIGSIGVAAAVPDPERRSAKDVQFVSSQSPKKRPNPNTEGGKEQIQAMVDDLAEVFVSTVARNRGVSADTVLSDFGQGSVMVGAKAVAAGLADRVGSFESLLAEMQAGRRKQKRMSARADEEKTVMTIKEIKSRVLAIFAEDETKPEEEQAAQPAEQVEEPKEKAEPQEEETKQVAAAAMAGESEALQRQIAERRSEQTSAAAGTFYDLMLLRGKMLPTERQSFMEDYMLAAMDDAAMPIEGISRVERLCNSINARSSHKLFEETITGPTHKVLASDENAQTEMSEDRRRELLSKTPTGKSALKAVK